MALVVPFVALATVVSVGRLRADAKGFREFNLHITRLEVQMNAISALEWAAIAQGKVTDESRGRLADSLARLRAPIGSGEQGGSSDGLAREVPEKVRRYTSAVEQEFALLTAGRVEEAEEVDEGEVDPGYEALHELGVRLQAESARRADSAERTADWGTTGGIIGSALFIALLLLVGERSRRRAAQAEARAQSRSESEQRFAALLEGSSDLLTVIDEEGRLRYVSAAASRLLGRAPEALVGAELSALLDEGERDETRRFLARAATQAGVSLSAEWRLRHADGSLVEAEARVRDLRESPLVGGIVVNLRDVGERKRLERDLRHQALHDPLTGLGNRIMFEDRVHHALARADRDSGRLAALFVDLDDFKNVNDSLGHAAGDDFLRGVAARISGALRASDTVARLGGDEFAILAEAVEDSRDAEHVADRVLKALEAPIVVAGRDIYARASIGIAVADGNQDPEPIDARVLTLLRNADVAMYAAKDRGEHGYQLFAASMYEAAAQRLELKGDLQRALTEREFVLRYQPIVDLDGSSVAGTEALVRWEHPERGLVPPLDFIPLAEETNLIVPLGAWVLREACRQLAEWRASGEPGTENLYMSVNVAGAQLQQFDFIDLVEDTLRAHGLPPASLVLEVTESSLLADTDANVMRLQALRDLGVRIAIDDFGTGYSALAYLRRFKTDVLKIDRSFVNGVAEPTHEAALVKTMIDMATTLGLETVAEGIEEHEQLQRLLEMHCRYGQGYHFAAPAPAQAILQLVAHTASVTARP